MPVRYGERISVMAIAHPEDDRYQDSDESESITAGRECSTRAYCNLGYGDFLYQHEDLMVFNHGGEIKCGRYEQTMCGKGDSQKLKDALSPAITTGLTGLVASGVKCTALPRPELIGICIVGVSVGLDTLVSPVVSTAVAAVFPDPDPDLYIPAGSYRQLVEVTCPTATPTPPPS